MDVDGAFEEALIRWLQQEAGVEEPRRVVSRSDSRILLSKFAPGFAERLRVTLDRRVDLFDDAAVAAAYARQASLSPKIARVETWRLAMSGMLADADGRSHLTPPQRAEVQAGIDSVAAVLASVLWSTPTAADFYEPQPGERAAYRDAVAQLGSAASPFTRRYGVYDGAQVVNHCPGAPYARTLLALGWRICTGTEPPVPDDAGSE
jgi:hypothetical protein